MNDALVFGTPNYYPVFDAVWLHVKGVPGTGTARLMHTKDGRYPAAWKGWKRGEICLDPPKKN